MISTDGTQNFIPSYRKKSSITSLSARNHAERFNNLMRLKKKNKRRLIPGRYVVVILGFMSFLTLTTQRINMSMALVAMVNHTAISTSLDTYQSGITSECPISESSNETEEDIPKSGGHFVWDAEIQSHIGSAGFFGYVLTQTPGGRLSETLGAKQMLTISLVTASLCNLLTPLTASLGAYTLVAVQFLKGVFQGLAQPSVSCLMAKWYPKTEKGFLSSITFAGFPGGSFFGGLIIGTLLDSHFLGGWPSVFYVFGVLGFLLAIPVFYCIENSPEEDKAITDEELKYITTHREFTCTTQNVKTPWGSILRSRTTWALLIGLFAHNWMCFYFLSVHPTYLGAVLHFTHTETGALMSFPYILQFVILSFSSYLSDFMVKKGMARTDTVRKTCTTIAYVGFIVNMAGVSFAGCDKKLNTIFFVATMCLVGFSYPGANIVPLDMSINFAGSLMGFSNSVSTTAGFIIPLIVGAITSKGQTVEQWCNMFYLSMGVVAVGVLVFIVFGSADRQDWDILKDYEQRKSIVEEIFPDPFSEIDPEEEDSPNDDQPYVIGSASAYKL